ncbi:MAG TPA: hypothetical protein VFQ43_14385 [Nitrososphaera sp.]|nr:hypothetical protein [Nitrososphaera sp.]
MWKNRSTIDIVVIMLAAVIGALLILTSVGLIAFKMFRPDADITRGAELIGDTMTMIVGALVGLIGGRAAGRLEANGVPK